MIIFVTFSSSLFVHKIFFHFSVCPSDKGRQENVLVFLASIFTYAVYFEFEYNLRWPSAVRFKILIFNLAESHATESQLFRPFCNDSRSLIILEKQC